MSITLETLRAVGAEAARSVDEHLEVVGVRSVTDGEYAEILLARNGCEIEPCLVMVGVFRDMTTDAVRAMIVDALTRHLARRTTEHD